MGEFGDTINPNSCTCTERRDQFVLTSTFLCACKIREGGPLWAHSLSYINTHKRMYVCIYVCGVCVPVECVYELLSDGNWSDCTPRGLTSCPHIHQHQRLGCPTDWRSSLLTNTSYTNVYMMICNSVFNLNKHIAKNCRLDVPKGQSDIFF